MLFRILFVLAFLNAMDLHAQLPSQGLSAWFESGYGLVSENNSVKLWEDRSPGKHHAVVYTENAPEVVPRLLNGHPVIRFNGLNTGLVTGELKTFPSKRGTLTIVTRITGKSLTSGAGYSTILSTYHGKEYTWQLGGRPGKYFFYDGVGSEEIAGGQNNDQWSVVSLLRTNDTTLEFYSDGKLRSSLVINPNQPGINSLKIGFNGRRGSYKDSIPEVLQGEIASIIMYDRVLDSKELEQLHQYLATKYSLYLEGPPLTQRWWFYPALIIIALLAGAGIARYFSVLRFRKKLADYKQKAAIEAERYRISRDMHDEIGSGLTHIALLSELIQTQKATDEVLKKDVSTISASARKLVESMSEIVWALNPHNDNLQNLAAYLREQTMNYFEPFDLRYVVHIPDDLPAVHISNEQRRNLFLVTKEALNNALKHADASQVMLRVEYKSGKLDLTVSDNGKGFAGKRKAVSSNGISNIQKRMNDIGGSFVVQTGDSGTKVQVSLQLDAHENKRTTTFFTPGRKESPDIFTT